MITFCKTSGRLFSDKKKKVTLYKYIIHSSLVTESVFEKKVNQNLMKLIKIYL